MQRLRPPSPRQGDEENVLDARYVQGWAESPDSPQVRLARMSRNQCTVVAADEPDRSACRSEVSSASPSKKCRKFRQNPAPRPRNLQMLANDMFLLLP